MRDKWREALPSAWSLVCQPLSCGKVVTFLLVLCYARSNDYDILLDGDFDIDIFKNAYFNDNRSVSLLSMADELGLKPIVPSTRPTMCARSGRDKPRKEIGNIGESWTKHLATNKITRPKTKLLTPCSWMES